MCEALISLQNVQLKYDTEAEEIIALDNVTLDVSAGELLAIVGASGSGKTSLINVMAGLMPASQGCVLVGGHDLLSLSSSQRADVRLNDVGVVFQDHNLIREFSVIENVSLPLRARGVSREAAEAEAEALLGLVGLERAGARYPRQLSGGQQQRVGIARALVGGKRIILTDEPTGSLDTSNSAAIFELLRRLADSGVCVAVASHDPQVLAAATRSITMADGRLLEHEAEVAG